MAKQPSPTPPKQPNINSYPQGKAGNRSFAVDLEKYKSDLKRFEADEAAFRRKGLSDEKVLLKKKLDQEKQEQLARQQWLQANRKNLGEMVGAVVGFGTTVRAVAQSLPGLFRQASGVMAQIGAELQGPLRLLAGLFQVAAIGMAGLVQISKSFGTVLSGLKDVLKSLVDSALNGFLGTIGATIAVIIGAVFSIAAFVAIIINAVTAGLVDFISTLNSIGSSLIIVLALVLKSAIDGVISSIEHLIDGLTKVIEGLITSALELGKSLIEMSYQLLQILLDLGSFVDQLVKGRRALALYNGTLLSAFMSLSFARFGRTRVLAQETGASSAALVASLNNLEQVFQPIIIALTNAMNRLGVVVADNIATFVAWITPTVTNFLNNFNLNINAMIASLNNWIQAGHQWLVVFINAINGFIAAWAPTVWDLINNIHHDTNMLISGFNLLLDGINLLIKAIYLLTPLGLFAEAPEIKTRIPLLPALPGLPPGGIPKIPVPGAPGAIPPVPAPNPPAPLPPPPRWNAQVIHMGIPRRFNR